MSANAAAVKTNGLAAWAQADTVVVNGKVITADAAFSIAEATGIPRETVRRKLKELAGRGVVMEKERGRYVMMPGFMQKPENDAALQQVLGHFVQLMNEAVRLGIVKMIRT